ncbi:hypothetical protein BDGGKGIB_02479 [Nodularia sphaerocarpa UHCC 0038]|nr:hypothetical protein BDGGKGIB_02479 [Nodularia sphaerocarpa UHCC 0038]
MERLYRGLVCVAVTSSRLVQDVSYQPSASDKPIQPPTL